MPFDIRSVVFARHAQHVVLVHFPIALFLIGVVFDVLGQRRRDSPFAVAAYYNLFVASLSTLPVVASGLLAWQWQFEGAALSGILLWHLIGGCVSSAMIWLVWWMHFNTRGIPGRPFPFYRWPIELLAVALISVTGHLGGYLTGVNR